MLPVPVEENSPVVFFDFVSIGFDISNNSTLLSLSGYKHNKKGTELAIKAAKYPKQYFNKVTDGCAIVC